MPSPSSRAASISTTTSHTPTECGTGARPGGTAIVACQVRRMKCVMTRHALVSVLSHSPPPGTVHRRPPPSRSSRPRTVAATSELRPAVLESVLGATPREFESRMLRHLDLRRHGARESRCDGDFVRLSQFLAQTCLSSQPKTGHLARRLRTSPQVTASAGLPRTLTRTPPRRSGQRSPPLARVHPMTASLLPVVLDQHPQHDRLHQRSQPGHDHDEPATSNPVHLRKHLPGSPASTSPPGPWPQAPP